MTKKYLLILFLLSGLYTFIGFLSLPKAPNIPGLADLLGWGFIGPLISIGLIWFFTRKVIAQKAQRLWVSSLFSAYFALTGYLALYYIVGVWYTI
ncbi:hypothetical protein [Reinekea sp.]|jgi:hypothetical protein|uniref:hypothetical protein n=1 Tax=Reinekea sp. TaxID=1970455 RepID=UPI003988F50D